MSDDDRSDFPTPPAHFLATSADATDASAAAGPGPSTAQHRAAAFLAAGADQPPLKKRGGSKDEERALTGGLEGEGASPPAKRSRKGAVPRRGRASSQGKAARAALGDDDDNEDDGDGSAYRSGSGDNDEDEDEDEDEDGDSDSDATSRSSSSRGGTPSTSRRRGRSVKSAAAVLDRGGIKLKASLRCHVPPPVPRLFRSEDLDALLAKVADVDGEGIEGLRDELRDALQSAMDPKAAEDLLEALEHQIQLYDHAYATLNSELAKAQVEESVLGNVKLIASNKRDDIRRAQKAERSFSPA